MTGTRSSFRGIVRIGPKLALISLAVVALSTAFSFAQGKRDCPAVIASLLPKTGVIRGGSFNLAGEMGMGSGAADLPFDHPCTKSEKYPARISVAVTYYGGQMAQLLQMQGDAADQQTLENAMGEIGSKKNPPRREKLGTCEIVYAAYETPCQPETIDTGKSVPPAPPTPHVQLKGVTHTANARIEIDLEGKISLDLAKAAVAEVIENFRKADFSKAK
jgi:hypothetical protein